MGSDSSRKIGYRETVAIGIGGMVGGGIFAVLGIAVQLAGGGTPVAFLVGGLIALVTAYSYSGLSVSYPGQGGTVAFLDRAFGPGLSTGSLNILLWLSYIVMLALYAHAFGGYGSTAFPPALQTAGKHVLISGVILLIAGLNMLSARIIGRAETWIVAIKIAILLLFCAAGFAGIDPRRLSPGTWASPISLVGAGMIIFVAYEGFELIANAGQDVANPARTLPRSYYSAVVGVSVLYVVIAAVTVGNLPVKAIVAARDYALAAAARPFLGQAGFSLIVAAALLSTASAINATLYGAARLSYVIAKDGELPATLEKKIWKRPLEGLLLTVGAALFLANALDLSSIATIGSAGFLLVFATVNAAAARLSGETGGRRWISILGAALCAAALAALIRQTAMTAAREIWILIALLGGSIMIETGYRFLGKRTLRLTITTLPEGPAWSESHSGVSPAGISTDGRQTMRRILIPLDPSPYSKAALSAGIIIAREHGGELTGLVILDTGAIEKSVGPVPIGGIEYADRIGDHRKKEAAERIESLLEDFRNRCRDAGVAHREAERQGSPSHRIMEESEYYDLVVMGLRTYYHFETQDNAGDSLDKVLDHSAVPILGVPAKVNLDLGGEPPPDILIAFDGSLPSARALHHFCRLWGNHPANVNLLLSDRDENTARHRLGEAEAYLHAQGLDRVKKRWTAEPIIKAVDRRFLGEADLVVAGAHSKKGLLDFMVGSLTRHLIEEAKKPLLIG